MSTNNRFAFLLLRPPYKHLLILEKYPECVTEPCLSDSMNTIVFLLFHVIPEILQEDSDSSFVTDADVALPVPLATNISSRCQDLL